MSSGRRGLLVIISSPSGAGKTTLAHRLIDEFDEVEFSVSYTTRPMRKGERDGVDYCFVDDATFDRMIAENKFAEWAVVHGNRYGTSRIAVEMALSGGRDVVFDVDGQGGRSLLAQWPDDALMVFILPPDLAVLEQRLRRRATDSEDVILRRLRKAVEELAYHRDYRYRIINDDLDAAYDTLRRIYLARRSGGNRDDSALNQAGTADHAEALIQAGHSV